MTTNSFRRSRHKLTKRRRKKTKKHKNTSSETIITFVRVFFLITTSWRKLCFEWTRTWFSRKARGFRTGTSDCSRLRLLETHLSASSRRRKACCLAYARRVRRVWRGELKLESRWIWVHLEIILGLCCDNFRLVLESRFGAFGVFYRRKQSF